MHKTLGYHKSKKKSVKVMKDMEGLRNGIYMAHIIFSYLFTLFDYLIKEELGGKN
jgi:hypothetical protein